MTIVTLQILRLTFWTNQNLHVCICQKLLPPRPLFKITDAHPNEVDYKKWLGSTAYNGMDASKFATKRFITVIAYDLPLIIGPLHT